MSIISDSPEFQRHAAAHPDDAMLAQIAIVHRAETALAADHAAIDFTRVHRPTLHPYSMYVAAELARTCSSQGAWAAAARETEARLYGAGGGPTLPPPAPLPPAPPTPAAAAAPALDADPNIAWIEQLEREEMHFAAHDERRRLAERAHHARRREVEAAVASQERLHKSLRNELGLDAADEWMREA